MNNQRSHFFFKGIKHTLPLLVSASPFGLIFGALAEPSGISMYTALAMSIFVYAGASQFIAIGLIASGTPLIIIIITTFIVNLRHLLYAAAIKDAIAHLSMGWRSLLAFGITDETYAAIISYFGKHMKHPQFHWFYLGSWLSMYINWIAWTGIGIYIGSQLPNIDSWGLEFAMVVTFIGIVFPLLRSKPYWFSAVTAGGLSLACAHWPYQLGLLFAALTGIAVGYGSSLFKQIETRDNNSAIKKHEKNKEAATDE